MKALHYFEQALTLDPRNVELLIDAARNLRHASTIPGRAKALRSCAGYYPKRSVSDGKQKLAFIRLEGNLKEAAKMLVEVNAQTPSTSALVTKITQLRLERNYAEAVRLLQARQAQFHFASEIEKGINQLLLAWCQRLCWRRCQRKSYR